MAEDRVPPKVVPPPMAKLPAAVVPPTPRVPLGAGTPVPVRATPVKAIDAEQVIGHAETLARQAAAPQTFEAGS